MSSNLLHLQLNVLDLLRIISSSLWLHLEAERQPAKPHREAPAPEEEGHGGGWWSGRSGSLKRNYKRNKNRCKSTALARSGFAQIWNSVFSFCGKHSLLELGFCKRKSYAHLKITPCLVWGRTVDPKELFSAPKVS